MRSNRHPPQLTRIEDATDIARVRAIVEGRLGRDFSLDHLPGTPALDSGFAYLVTNGRDTVTDALTGVPVVYALTLTVTVDREPVTVFVYATSPDVHGAFVYSVSRCGDAWPVFFSPPTE